MRRRRIQTVAILAVIVTAAGCGRKAVPVTGQVFVNGKPLVGAAVMFIPEEADGHAATGQTDETGTFNLATYRQKGAFPGSYKVTVRYTDPIKIPLDIVSSEKMQAAHAEAGANMIPSLVLPEKYTHEDQTILKHRVPDDGDPKFELASLPPAASP